MPEAWTGHLIGKMHNKDVTYDELASELGCTKSYISMILNGARKPVGMRERMEEAVNTIINRRSCTVDDLLKQDAEQEGS